MALTTLPSEDPVLAASKEIRRKAKHAILTLEQDLLSIASDVTAQTKSAIATQLGGDAAAFASFYDDGRALVLSVKPESTIPTRASLP